MRPFMRRPHGFSIAEAMIAAVIFVIAAAGVFATIGNIRKPSAKTDKSLVAAYVGQQILEDLRTRVDAGTWSNPADALYGDADGTVHNCCNPPACGSNTTVKNGITYQCSYTVTQQANGARQVTVNITWPDTN